MKKYTSVFSTAIIALVLFGVGCDTTDRDTMTEPNVTPTPAAAMTPETYPSPTASPGEMGTTGLAEGATHSVADITGNPSSLIGKTVTVVADVDEVYGPRAFKLDEDSSLAGGIDNDLLVLSPKAATLTDIDDQWDNNKVRVTGVVQRMVAGNIERELGWDLQPNLEAEFRNKPVLIARSIERLNK
ncbi:MAG: hypothetical protein AB7U82_10210 [Blastocatellales bacterium]